VIIMAKKSRSSIRPCILVIDDDPDAADAAKVIIGRAVNTICSSPNDVTDRDLERANLVLVDFKLDRWPERDAQTTPSLKPQHGIALAATLRSNLGDGRSKSPTAFALHSGKLAELSGTLSADNREHAIARILDLEWVFPNEIDPTRLSVEVRSLAQAVMQLPHPWPQFQNAHTALIRLLWIDKKAIWSRLAIEDVEKAYPPQDIVAETSKGMALIRWLLHEVMPFPSFLLDERYLAVRLHIVPESLRSILKTEPRSGLAKTLDKFRYRGLLNQFAGHRWWRAGIDHWLWRETDGNPLSREAIRKLVQKKLPSSVRLADFERPVVCLDDQFLPTDNFIELTSAVQIKPDDWPATAEPAWVAIEEAQKEPRVAARVVSLDRAKLKQKSK
jgi:hypothetical protein